MKIAVCCYSMRWFAVLNLETYPPLQLTLLLTKFYTVFDILPEKLSDAYKFLEPYIEAHEQIKKEVTAESSQ
jgi:hypothetical protein